MNNNALRILQKKDGTKVLQFRTPAYMGRIAGPWLDVPIELEEDEPSMDSVLRNAARRSAKFVDNIRDDLRNKNDS